MALSDSSAVAYFIKEETNWGGIPAGAYETLRVVSDSLTQETDTFMSEEIRSDRITPDIIRGSVRALGDIVTELSWGNDFLLRFAQMNDWAPAVAIDVDSQDIRSDPAGGAQAHFTRLTHNTQVTFFAGTPVGAAIRIDGASAAANDGIWRVVGKDTGGEWVDVDDPEGFQVDTTAVVQSVTVQIESVLTASVFDTNESFSIQKVQQDSDDGIAGDGSVQVYVGCYVDRFSGSFEVGSTPRMTYGIRGKQAISSNALTGSQSAAPTGEVMNPVDHVSLGRSGALKNLAGGNPYDVADLRSFSFQASNQLRDKPQIGSVFSAGIGRGMQQIEGSVTAYFRDRKSLEDYLSFLKVGGDSFGTVPVAASPHAQSVVVEDTAGNAFAFDFPQIVYTSHRELTPGKDQDVMAEIGFNGFLRTETGGQFVISRFPAI